MPRNLRIFTIVTLKTQVQVESAPPVIESQAVSRSDDVCSFHRADDCMFRTVTDANLHPLTFHPCRLGKHRRELRRCLGWLCKGKGVGDSPPPLSASRRAGRTNRSVRSMQRNTRAIFIIREGTALIQGTASDCKNANLRPCRGSARKAVSRIAMVLRLVMSGGRWFADPLRLLARKQANG